MKGSRCLETRLRLLLLLSSGSFWKVSGAQLSALLTSRWRSWWPNDAVGHECVQPRLLHELTANDGGGGAGVVR